MNAKPIYTSGDWYYGADGLDFEIYADEQNTPSRDKSLAIVFEGADHTDGEGEANARLMAAAPELLHALRTLVERDRAEAAESGFTDDEMSWLEDARRVIAKATGS